MANVTHVSEVKKQDREGYSYWRIVDQKNNPFNLLKIQVDGTHGARRVLEGVRNYYVINGEGSFTIGGIEYPVRGGSHVYISPDEVYSYTGEMYMIEFNIDLGNGISHEDV